MVSRRKLNPIFQDEEECPGPIVFNVPSSYNEKVKIHDWQTKALAEPRDNTEMFPPKGNLHLSSYQRLAPGKTECTGISETSAMLSQIESRDEYRRIYPQRALAKMRSLARGTEPEKEPIEANLKEALIDPEEVRRMDYRSTSKLDYRLPYPLKRRPAPPVPVPLPWILNRRSIGYSLDQLERRDGINTFLDDNMELHRRIAEVKMQRNRLHEILPPKVEEVEVEAEAEAEAEAVTRG